jgi:tripartite ATP-independent transporter DctM subunit
MLIPPSVLMIVWAVLTEISIGDLFLAGILPGFLLVGFFVAYIIGTAWLNPGMAGNAARKAGDTADLPSADQDIGIAMFSTLLVIGLVIGTLLGIWLGFFTPTEGAGVGAAAALLLAIAKGVRLTEIKEVVLSVGRTTAPLLLLLFTAQLYSRVLTMTGFTRAVQELLLGTGLGPWSILALMVLIWFVLGCIIDSISIILLTVPIFAPIAATLGFDPLAFAIMGIIAIETGLLTPPFGLLVFTVKASLPAESISVGKIFAGAIPYWIALVSVVACIGVYPEIATALPKFFKGL